MSDTPETDAEQHEGLLRTNPIPMQVVTANFARHLERERDKAREALKHVEEYGTEEINAAVKLRQKLASALVERDEAIESRKKWEKAAFELFDLCEERRGK